MFPQTQFQSYVFSGQAYSAEVDANGLSLNHYLRIKIDNPTGSGKFIQLYGLSASSSAGNTLVMYKNPTTSVTTNTVTPTNASFVSSNTSDMDVTWDTNTSSLSGTVYRHLPLNSNWQEFNPFFYLPAGQSIGFQSKSLLNQDFTVNISWIEI